MKVGVVCEGYTDYLAIKHYLGSGLASRGIRTTFVPLQPPPDNTSGGGWANVLMWLVNNGPERRRPYFQAGLFANSERLANIDVLVLHLDTDILPEISFKNFVGNYGLVVGTPTAVPDKAKVISTILEHFAKFSELTDLEKMAHVPAPIAESSEAWCVAADEGFEGNPEMLSGQRLIDAFGAALSKFNGSEVKASYGKVNKTLKARDKYCLGSTKNVHLLVRCSLFNALLERLSTASV